jgi:cobalt-zinc-cadmium efflux system membrane fusion protein
MKGTRILACCAAVAVLASAGCGNGNKDAKPKAEAPARVESKPAGETALAIITLKPEAVDRLGIETATAAYKTARGYYSVAGEVVVPPGQVLAVNAPVAGSIALVDGKLPHAGSRLKKGQNLFMIAPLLPVERDLLLNAKADVDAADTRLEAAKARAERAAEMLRDQVGSERALEDAEEARRLAETALESARSKLEQIKRTPMSNDISIAVQTPEPGILRQVYVADGQIVSAGASLYEVAQLDPVWVRAPVYSGDVDLLDQKANAMVRPINAKAGHRGRAAAPVTAPPSADPVTVTTDLFYRLANADLSLNPGELVRISIPKRGEEACLQIPYAAVLYDIHGGAWVYESIESNVFSRRKVAVESISDEAACLSDGLEAGTVVVTDGAAELFGAEFGARK